jgi:hypothetical protein
MLLTISIIVVIIIVGLTGMHLKRFFNKATEYEILEQYYANVLRQGLLEDYKQNPYLLMDYKYPLLELKNSNLVSKWSYSTETIELKEKTFYSHREDSLWIIGKNGITVDLYIWNLSEHFEKEGIEKIQSYQMKGEPDIEYISIVVPENALLSVPRFWYFSLTEKGEGFVSKSPISKLANMISGKN